jgi:tetratricopeptide (TPR) repeat protein
MVRDVGRIFFGRDVQCAQCHDHPLIDDYEQSEFFGILSFVNRTYLFTDEQRGKLAFLGEKAEGELEFASVFQPARGKTTARPVLPMALAMDAEPGAVDDADAYLISPAKDQRAIPRYSRRQQLAVLATHPENQAFNRNLANRLWSHLLGTGVVHPVDLHHSGNPPVSATLLRHLSDELVAQGYDLRAFVREVVLSQTYQRSLIPPDLRTWGGPAGGVATLSAELAALEQQLAALAQPQANLAEELSRAREALDRAQAQVDRVQADIRATREELQKKRAERDQLQPPLTEAQARKQKHQELIDSLKAALAEADKAVQLAPEDQELAKSREGLNARLAAAMEALGQIDQALEYHQKQLRRGNDRVTDLRSRVVALSNRRLALGEFVVEARGVQRRIHSRQQALADAQSDLALRQQRWTELKEWLELRDEAQRNQATGDAKTAAEWQERLRQRESDLVESWRRGFALRGIRGLSPEQLAGSFFSSLGLDVPIRAKILAEWTSANPGQAVDLAQQPELRKKIELAVADQVWNAEDDVAERFGAPGGTPQDAFFSTTDQALLLQNSPGFLGWLKPVEGTLTHRLQSRQDAAEVADELYRAVFARPPDREEREHLATWLTQGSASPQPPDRTALLQELIWGMLASTEFRFFP